MKPRIHIEESGSIDWDFYEAQERAYEDAQEDQFNRDREDPEPDDDTN